MLDLKDLHIVLKFAVGSLSQIKVTQKYHNLVYLVNHTYDTQNMNLLWK